MSTHAFIDESTRGPSYVICAATLAIGDLDSARRTLLALRARGQGRLHFATESDRRRRQLLSAISSVEANSSIFVASHRDQVKARSAILRYAALHLHQLGVSRLVIEARQGQDQRDRADLYAALGSTPTPAMPYLHHTATAEPLLWIPDSLQSLGARIGLVERFDNRRSERVGCPWFGRLLTAVLVRRKRTALQAGEIRSVRR